MLVSPCKSPRIASPRRQNTAHYFINYKLWKVERLGERVYSLIRSVTRLDEDSPVTRISWGAYAPVQTPDTISNIVSMSKNRVSSKKGTSKIH